MTASFSEASCRSSFFIRDLRIRRRAGSPTAGGQSRRACGVPERGTRGHPRRRVARTATRTCHLRATGRTPRSHGIIRTRATERPPARCDRSPPRACRMPRCLPGISRSCVRSARHRTGERERPRVPGAHRANTVRDAARRRVFEWPAHVLRGGAAGARKLPRYWGERRCVGCAPKQRRSATMLQQARLALWKRWYSVVSSVTWSRSSAASSLSVWCSGVPALRLRARGRWKNFTARSSKAIARRKRFLVLRGDEVDAGVHRRPIPASTPFPCTGGSRCGSASTASPCAPSPSRRTALESCLSAGSFASLEAWA